MPFVIVQWLSCIWLSATPWLQHVRLPCPSLSHRVWSNSCPLIRWCHPTISFSVTSSPAVNLSQHQSLFNESALHIRWPKYWSFSIGPSNEYSELISFRIDWFDLLAVQGTLKSLLQQFKSINSLVLSFLYGPTLKSIHDYWKNIALTIQNIVDNVMSLLFNMLSGFVIAFFQGASVFQFHGYSHNL